MSGAIRASRYQSRRRVQTYGAGPAHLISGKRDLARYVEAAAEPAAIEAGVAMFALPQAQAAGSQPAMLRTATGHDHPTRQAHSAQGQAASRDLGMESRHLERGRL